MLVFLNCAISNFVICINGEVCCFDVAYSAYIWIDSTNDRIIRYDTIQYGRLTCSQKLTTWPA